MVIMRPKCDIVGDDATEKCFDAVYCSCLNSDFIDHAHQCPLVLEEIKAEHEEQQARRVHESRTLAQALLQQGTNRMS